MNIQIYRLLTENMQFDLFRSEMEHMHVKNTDKGFVTIILTYNFVENFWKKEWYAKSFYTLAMLDYLSDKHKVPYYEPYNYYRTQKLENIIYPLGVLMLDEINGNHSERNKAIRIAKEDPYGKYFLKYNIIEVSEDTV